MGISCKCKRTDLLDLPKSIYEDTKELIGIQALQEFTISCYFEVLEQNV